MTHEFERALGRPHTRRGLLKGTLAAGVGAMAASAVGGRRLAQEVEAAPKPGRGSGAVYAMTNEVAANRVVTYRRANDGTLTAAGAFATGGTGTGDILGGVQGALLLDTDVSALFAVNGGSNEISIFAAGRTALTLFDKVPSGGVRPGSLTLRGNTLYVLNTGDPVTGAGSNITGFSVSPIGKLSPLAGSTRPLSGAAITSPAQVQFSPDGTLLVVTEKATNLIDTYRVGADGLVSGPLAQPSHGVTPFGFAFSPRGQLLVSEAFEALPGKGAASSYAMSPNGQLTVVSGSVRNTQTETCWLVITSSGRYAYETNYNAISNTVSSYRVVDHGRLHLLEGVAGRTGDGPRDEALSRDSRYLYTLNHRDGTISAFAVQHDGSLAQLPDAGGLPAGSPVGLAAR